MPGVYERATPASATVSGVTVRRTARAVRTAREWVARRSAEWQVRLALGFGLGGSNAVGVGVVYVLATLVVPMPEVASRDSVQIANLVLAGVYVLVAGIVGIVHAWRRLHPVVVMIRPGGRPTEADQRKVLAAPRRIFLFQALLWAIGSFVFFGFNAQYSWVFAVSVLLIVGLAGWTTSSLTYLLAERSLRPVARRVLREGIPERRYVRSVASRSMFAWMLGTGFTVLGIVLIGIVSFVDHQSVSTRQLALTTVVLGGITIVVGGFTSYVAAQASSDPIRNLREAYGRVETGDFEVEVPIYDGTEIGMLQAGFNQMLHGLKEREELRDLFGRHVGADVARSALEKGVRLGGEARDVAVLFVDIIGSTTLAEDRPPEEVVELLNRFFDVVIDVVHEHEGWINKFEGDAALAVWGAPIETAGMQTSALRAARVMGRRLEDEVPEIRAGIGVSCGTAVAGNVGTAERYEYTVIGDPVNEAARLTGLAKKVPARVVASCALLECASDDEAGHWTELEPVTVRGKSRPTRIATPA